MDYDNGVRHTSTFHPVEDAHKFCTGLSGALAHFALFDFLCVSGLQELLSTRGYMPKAIISGTGRAI